MKITTEDLGDRQVLLTIEVDEERVEKALRGVARRLSKEHAIPGFRRGRAPYRVIMRRFGRETLLREALDDLGQNIIEEAMKGEDLELYGPGSLEDVQLDPLVFKVRVPLRPTVDLGDYRELRVEPPVVAVDEEAVQAELERLRQANVVLEPAGDRPARWDDRVTLDVKADVEGEPYVRQEDYDMVLDAADDSFAPGFSEQIVGMQVGEEKSFVLTLPGGGEADAAVPAREATFTVTLHDVKGRILPDLDDDLARTVGDYDTLEELDQSVRRKLEEKEQSQADQAYVEEVLEALVASADVQFPPDMVEDQIDNNVKDLEKRLEGQGMALDDFLKLKGLTGETYRESLRPQVERTVRRGLALGELALREHLDVGDEEVNQRIALMSAAWGEHSAEIQQMLSTPESVRSVTNELLTDKVVQRLAAIARGEAPALEELETQAEESSQEPEAAQGEGDTREIASAEAELAQ